MDLPHALMFQKIASLINQDEKFKKDLVDSLNKNVDLIWISENTEEYIISSLLNTVTGVLEKSANQAVLEAQQRALEEQNGSKQ